MTIILAVSEFDPVCSATAKGTSYLDVPHIWLAHVEASTAMYHPAVAVLLLLAAKSALQYFHLINYHFFYASCTLHKSGDNRLPIGCNEDVRDIEGMG